MRPAELAAQVRALPGLPALDRAAAAKRLIDQAKRTLSEVRKAAISQAAAEGMSHAQIADALGVSVPAVNAAITEHRRWLGRILDQLNATDRVEVWARVILDAPWYDPVATEMLDERGDGRVVVTVAGDVLVWTAGTRKPGGMGVVGDECWRTRE